MFFNVTLFKKLYTDIEDHILPKVLLFFQLNYFTAPRNNNLLEKIMLMYFFEGLTQNHPSEFLRMIWLPGLP